MSLILFDIRFVKKNKNTNVSCKKVNISANAITIHLIFNRSDKYKSYLFFLKHNMLKINTIITKD